MMARTAEGITRKREQDKLRKRRLRAADPEGHRAEQRAYYREYRRLNRTRIRRYMATYREENHDRIQELQRSYYEANRAWFCDESKRRKALRRGAPIAARVDRARVLKLHAGLCGLCGRLVDPENWHLDHVWPLSVGGWHDYSNVQPTHPFCNISKKDGWIRNGLLELVLA